jgi:hypothetical protein
VSELNGIVRSQREVHFILVEKLGDEMPRLVVCVDAEYVAVHQNVGILSFAPGAGVLTVEFLHARHIAKPIP